MNRNKIGAVALSCVLLVSAIPIPTTGAEKQVQVQQANIEEKKTVSNNVERVGFTDKEVDVKEDTEELTFIYGERLRLPEKINDQEVTFQYNGEDVKTLTPDKAGDYELDVEIPGSESKKLIVHVNKKQLQVKNTTVKDKIYDGNVYASYQKEPLIAGVVDTLSYAYGEPEFEQKDAGTGIKVLQPEFQLDPEYADRYELIQPTDETAEIKKRSVSVKNTIVEDKTYDGTTKAKWVKAPELENIVSGDEVILDIPEPHFQTADAEKDIPIVLEGVFDLRGTAAKNYELLAPEKTKAEIKKAPLIFQADDKEREYGQENPKLSYKVTGFVGDEDTSLEGYREPALSCGVTKFTSLGEHKGAIVIENAGVPKNYEAVYKNGNLKITATVAQRLVNYSVNTPNGQNGYFVNGQPFIITPVQSETSDYDKISVSADGPWLDKLNFYDDTQNGKIHFYLKDSKTGAVSKVGSEIYKADHQRPEIDNVSFKLKNKDGFHRVLNLLSFKHFFNRSIQVTIEANDETSGVKQINYSLQEEGRELLKKQAEKKVVTFDLPPNFKGHIFAEAADSAGNQSGIFKSNGVIVENKEQHIKTGDINISLNPLTKRKDYYNRDIFLDLEVESTYSGIHNLTYQLGDDEKEVQVTKEGKSLTSSWTKKKAVLKKENNRNHTKAKVIYQDNAGFQSVQTKYFNIDISRPEITVKYDKNDSDGTYYNSGRTAQISIDERNFSNENTEILISRDGKQKKIKANFVADGGLRTREDGSQYYRYVMNLPFKEDGDYTFRISTVDKAGNKNEGVTYVGTNPTKFTVDKTSPKAKISFNNHDVQNGKYYKKSRTATISIKEHNFDTGRVQITTNGSKGGWIHQGDLHKMHVYFQKDGEYNLNVSARDRAGNASGKLSEHPFVIDQTAPVIRVLSPKSQSANKGEVEPAVVITDINYSSGNSRLIKEGGKSEKSSVLKSKHGETIRFQSIPKQQAKDGYYTLTATARDKAGNVTKNTIHFTINRYGSVYKENSYLKEINESYIRGLKQDLILKEYNPDRLKEQKVTITRNGQVLEGRFHTIKSEDTPWGEYTYHISKEAFKEEGVYQVLLSSVDRANHQNSNGQREKNSSIRFGIDKTNPQIVITGLQKGQKVYPEEMKIMKVMAFDNLVLDHITIFKNGSKYQTYHKAKEEYEVAFTKKDQLQTIEILAVDKAGNQYRVKKDFYVTKNLWIRYTHSIPMLVGSVVIAFLVLAIAIYLGKKHRKKRKGSVAEFTDKTME